MNHEQLKDLILQYHDGALADGDRGAVENHLAGCAECRESLAAWKRAARLFFAPLQPATDEKFVNAVMSKLDAAKIRRGGFIQRWRDAWNRPGDGVSPLRWVAAGASALAVLTLIFYRAPRATQPSAVESAEALSYASEEISTLASADDAGASYGTAIEEYFL